MSTSTQTPTQEYTVEQQAARDYMKAAKTIKALKADMKAAQDAQRAALDTLSVAYPVKHVGQRVLAKITGCWNVPLTFENRLDRTVKWAKVVEAMRPHLTSDQERMLENIIYSNEGKRNVREVRG